MLASIFRNLFSAKPQSSNTASIAKERLQIVVSHHRKSRNLPDFVKHLEKDILEVLQKYVQVDSRQVQVNLEHDSDESKLELNVTFQESEKLKAKKETVE